MTEKIIMKYEDKKDLYTLSGYESTGGYDALKKAIDMKKDEIVEEVKRSTLRGRGGAGFATGLKWSFVPKDSGRPVYLCCNADESEPGTFKDKWIIWNNPHLLIEGILISSYALSVKHAFIYIRGEFREGSEILNKAIEEAQNKNYLGKNILGRNIDIEITVYRGAGAYVCGEETGLLESLEGKRGWPRIRPPFPATKGLYQSPTIINNVETLANIPYIILNGAVRFASIGTPNNGGTKLFCVSGRVNRPGVYELPLGTNLREIIENYAAGVKDGKKIKAVIPGGSSTPVLKFDEIDIPMDFDSLIKAGSALGSGGIIVLDEDTSMVRSLYNLSRFYAHESCGQCTPCREGTIWIMKILRRIYKGDGKPEDLDLLLDICSNIKFKTVCPFGDAAVIPVESFITKFRTEFEEAIKKTIIIPRQ
ncbi:MAG: NADH-quinone oxidoreductase subunit NuoF [Candidatus Hydrogenedentota bacterium]